VQSLNQGLELHIPLLTSEIRPFSLRSSHKQQRFVISSCVENPPAKAMLSSSHELSSLAKAMPQSSHELPSLAKAMLQPSHELSAFDKAASFSLFER
jgi:hypothetical protein